MKVQKAKKAGKKRPLPKNGGDELHLKYGMSESGSEVKKV